MTPDFTHPGYRAPKKKESYFLGVVMVLIFVASIFLYVVVVPAFTQEAEAAEMPGITDEEAHRIVEEYEGQTRELCKSILGEI